MQNNPNFEGTLSWDSQISQESSFILLEPGVYQFRVDKMERSTYNPSPQSSIRDASPMAELELKIDDGSGGIATVFENLILHTKTEWKISEFFTAIGQKQKGIPFTPNWAGVPQSTGYCEIIQNEYTDKSGNKKTNNRVERFLTPEEGQSKATPQQAATQAQQPPVQNQQQTPQSNPGFNF